MMQGISTSFADYDQLPRNGYHIDREYWAQHDIFFQMGNIASEVGRSIKACRNKKIDRMNKAIDRAVDLLDATIECLAHQRSPRLKEVLRAREEYLRLFFDDRFDEDADNIERYFMWFAVASRNGAAERYEDELDARDLRGAIEQDDGERIPWADLKQQIGH